MQPAHQLIAPSRLATRWGTTPYVVGVVVVLGMMSVVASVVWTHKSYADTTSGVALAAITALTAGGLALRGLVQGVAWPAAVVLASGAAIAIAMTTRETFSIWLAGTALLCLTCAPTSRATPGTQRWTSVAIAFLGATAGITWAATHVPREIAPSLFPVAVSAVVLVSSAGLLTAIRRVAGWRAQAQAAAALQQRNAELSRRTSLARELHDALGHSITTMIVQAEAGQVGSPTDALRTIGDLGRTAMDELEDVLFDLRGEPAATPPLELQKIEDQLLPALRSAGIQVTATVNTQASDHDVLLTAYRLVQESLTNVMKHSDAQHVTVEVFDEGNRVVVRVRDDGRGAGDRTSTGTGVAGMKARVEELGGTFSWTRATPHGVWVEAWVPRGAA